MNEPANQKSDKAEKRKAMVSFLPITLQKQREILFLFLGGKSA